MVVKLTDVIKIYDNVEKSGDFTEWVKKLKQVAKLLSATKPSTFLPLFLAAD